MRRTPGLTLKATNPTFTEWITFIEQFDPKSPWADRRVRLAANLAINRQAFNEAEYLGFARVTASIIPRDFQFFWAPPLYPHDPAAARKLLAEAGYPRGFDAGEIACDAVYAATVEAVVNDFQAVGIRAQVRALERAAFYKTDAEKGFKRLVRPGSAAGGNAATRIEAFVITGGIRAYGGYPDIDALFRDQSGETDVKKREALLHKIQQLMHERVMFAPIVEPAFLSAYGPRVEQPGMGLITGIAFSMPYEELRLKPRAAQ